MNGNVEPAGSAKGLLALLLETRSYMKLLGAPGIATRNKVRYEHSISFRTSLTNGAIGRRTGLDPLGSNQASVQRCGEDVPPLGLGTASPELRGSTGGPSHDPGWARRLGFPGLHWVSCFLLKKGAVIDGRTFPWKKSTVQNTL